jgi:hypothetical protein
MATTIDWSGARNRIIIPQADLTLIGGTLFELDTDVFFNSVKLLEAAVDGIVFQNAIDHNAAYTVFGASFARKIEIMNSTNINPVLGGPNIDEFEVFFSPDTTYSVRLKGSNNNIADLQNLILANTVTQVIPTNSAGLIKNEPGLGSADVALIFGEIMEDGETFAQSMRLIRAAAAGQIVQLPDGSYLVKSKDGLKDRIDGSLGANNSRNIDATDSS